MPSHPRTLAELAHYQWPPTISFAHRLAMLRTTVQNVINTLPDPPDHNPFTPRCKAVVQLSLDDLRLVLPPREQQVLDCLRAKKSPTTTFRGQQGFIPLRELYLVVQRTVSRVQRLCGSTIRQRLLQHHDRRGHARCRKRPGRPRTLPALDRIPQLIVYLPTWLAADPPDGVRVLE